MNKNISNSTDDTNNDVILSTLNVDTNFFVTFDPAVQKDSFWRNPCLKEHCAIKGIQHSFSSLGHCDDVFVYQHFEDDQTEGDFDLIVGDDEKFHCELKRNPKALETGFFNVEFYRTEHRKNSGLTKTLDEGVDLFFFALPSFNPAMDHKEEFREYADQFYYCYSTTLWKWILHPDNRVAMNKGLQMNFDKKNPAVMFSVPIDCPVFKRRKLHWDTFYTKNEPEFFKEIFGK